MPWEETTAVCLCFLHSVITTWSTSKFARQKRHYWK